MKNVVIATACIATLVSGCTTNFGGQSPNAAGNEAGTFEQVSAAQAQPDVLESTIIKAFPDIPIPASHTIDLNRSLIFTSPNQTAGKIALEGKENVEKVFNFYEEEMAAQGWSLVNAFQSSTASLYYAKPGRFVAIIIESTGRNGSRVLINIGPE